MSLDGYRAFAGRVVVSYFTLRKLECFKQACALNILAWNNEIELWIFFIGFENHRND